LRCQIKAKIKVKIRSMHPPLVLLVGNSKGGSLRAVDGKLDQDLRCQKSLNKEEAEVKEECISILNAPFPLLPPVQTSRAAGQRSEIGSKLHIIAEVVPSI
jgi:hypothetical protein